ncbi:MAG: mycofactocin biosynthesis peptidyl-dipeptidase MftE [Sciscionella sp.]
MSALRLDELSWRELDGIAARCVLLIPLGATEQHGTALPYTVDSEIATALAGRIALDRSDTVLAPTVAYGASGEHAAFAGTLSIGAEATELVLVELGRSADAFAGVLFVCCHGGNAEPLRSAVTLLRAEGRDVRAWAPRGEHTDSHAGAAETSAMLALRPASVRSEALQAGNTADLRELLPAVRAGGIAAVSPNGVLGDPREASAERGARLLEAWAAELAGYAHRCWPTRDGDPA